MRHSPGTLRHSPDFSRHSPEKMLQLKSCAWRGDLWTRHSLSLERRFVRGMPRGVAFAAGDERGMRLERSFAPHSLSVTSREGEGMDHEGEGMGREGPAALREGQGMPREGQGMRFAERLSPLRRAL